MLESAPSIRSSEKDLFASKAIASTFDSQNVNTNPTLETNPKNVTARVLEVAGASPSNTLTTLNRIKLKNEESINEVGVL